MMAEATPRRGRSLGQVIAYALPNIPLATMHLPVMLVLPAFYAQNTAAGLAAIGTALMAGRIIDAVTDPLMGYLSDRSTFGRWGRKGWVLAGTPLAALAIYFLYAPSASSDAPYFFVWSILLYVAWTIIEVPYAAWGAELSHDYHERARIMTFRNAFGFVGGLLFMASPILTSPWSGTTEFTTLSLSVLGTFIIVALPLFAAVAVTRVPRGVAHGHPGGGSLGQYWAALKRNRPLRLFLLVVMIQLIGGGSWSASVLIFTDNHLGLGHLFPVFLAVAWGTRLACAPVWLALIRRLGKHRVWAVGSALSALVTPLVLVVQPGPQAAAAVFVYAVALGFIETAWMIAPAAMLGDVADYDTLKTGRNRMGVYHALNGLAQKAFLALGGGIGFYIMSTLGYDLHGANGPVQTLGLFTAFALFPAVCYGCCAAIVWRFPIGAARQEVIRRALNRRAARARP